MESTKLIEEMMKALEKREFQFFYSLTQNNFEVSIKMNI